MLSYYGSARILAITSGALAFACAICFAQEQPEAAPRITFTTYSVPGAVNLGVESINNAGTNSGYYTDVSGNTIGYLRTSGGTITTYTDPLNTSAPLFARGGQINTGGSVGGEFYNTADAAYEGYIYKSGAGTFRSFVYPGQPAGTTTSIAGLNDNGVICGYYIPSPFTTVFSFIGGGGMPLTSFTANGSSNSGCYAVNNAGVSVGFSTDTAGTYHGWKRDTAGTITSIDVPGASTVPGTAPCVSTPIAGSVALGVNNSGYISGHYWDASYNEHGFLLTPAGKFFTINVPGAFQTAGGGLNDRFLMVGHYADSACNNFGFVATL